MIVPLYKKDTAGAVSNYRPVSLTSVLSKILERILAVKIIDHLHTNNLLSPEQHDIFKRRSTSTNLLESFNEWTLNIELCVQTAVMYIDFAKAFDNVSHHRLFVKLYVYGIRGKPLSWLAFSVIVLSTRPG